MPDVSGVAGPIHLLDELTVRPGRLDSVRSLLRERYLPGARRRGMELTATWVSPPVERVDAPVDLFLLWTVADVRAWWSMRRESGGDPEVVALWDELAPDLVTRTRRVLVGTPLGQPGDRA